MKKENTMLRLGTDQPDTRSMHNHDIFLARLKLLVISAKAYLGNYPLGKFRKEAVIKNAKAILTILAQDISFEASLRRINETLDGMDIDYLLNERVKLLAFMAQAFAEDFPIGYHRRRVIENNVDYICDVMKLNDIAMDADFLKVA
jgi:hypothetical protein